jgi:hypothetical protein
MIKSKKILSQRIADFFADNAEDRHNKINYLRTSAIHLRLSARNKKVLFSRSCEGGEVFESGNA